MTPTRRPGPLPGPAARTGRRTAALVAALTGMALLASCTGGDDGGTESFPEDGPAWVVITTGEGFSEAGDGDAPQGWVPLLVHQDGCSVAGRGIHVEEALEDARAESTAAVETLVAEEGLEAGDPREMDMIVSGGVGQDDDLTLPFLVAEGSDGTDEVRFAARAGARVDYEGDASTDMLQLRLACPDAISDEVWEELRDGLRADLSTSGATADDPWGTTSAP